MRLGPRARRAAPRLTHRAAVSAWAWARGRGAGGGGAYSLLCPQGLPLPPLGARARARSETRWSDKCYFPAQSRWARLDWRRRPGHADPAAGQCAGPRRLPTPRPESSTAIARDGFPLPAGDHVRKGLFNGVSTAPGPTWQNPFDSRSFFPVVLDFFSKWPPKSAASQDLKVAGAPRSRRPLPGREKGPRETAASLRSAGHRGAAGRGSATPIPQLPAPSEPPAPAPVVAKGPVTHSRETLRRRRSTPRNTSWCRRKSLSPRRHLSPKTLRRNKET